MDLYEKIREMPMFKRFTEEEKKRFAELDLTVLNFPPDYTIIEEGDEGSEFYLLLEGTVKVSKTNQNISIALLDPGAVFGEMAAIMNERRSSSVITDEDVLVVRIDDDFFQAITTDMLIKVKDYFLELLIIRLNRMNDAVVKLAKFALGRSSLEDSSPAENGLNE